MRLIRFSFTIPLEEPSLSNSSPLYPLVEVSSGLFRASTALLFWIVSFDACLWRFWTLLKKCCASDLSSKRNPTEKSSISKLWKKSRSWEYWKSTQSSWSQSTPWLPITSTSLKKNVCPMRSSTSTTAPMSPVHVHSSRFG